MEEARRIYRAEQVVLHSPVVHLQQKTPGHIFFSLKLLRPLALWRWAVSNPSMREQGSHLQPRTAMAKVNGTRSTREKLYFSTRACFSARHDKSC